MTSATPAPDPLAAVLSVAEGLDTMVSVQRAIDAAMAFTEARYGAIGLFGPDGSVSEFVYRGISDEQRERIGPLPSGRGVLGLLAQRSGPLRLDRLSDHPAAAGFPQHHPVMTAFLGAPIIIDGSPVGSFYMADKHDGSSFTDADEAIVGALANAVGVAVRNYRVFRRTEQRERWQRAATAIDYAVLAGSPPTDVLHLIAAEARRLSGADVAMVALPDGARLDVRIVDVRNARSIGDARWSVDRSRRPAVAHDAHLELAKQWRGLTCDAQCLLTEAFDTGQSMLAPGSQGLPSGAPGADAFATAVAIPMRTSERSLGVLGLLWDHAVPRLTGPSMEVAEAFAAQAAVTLMLADARTEYERLLVYRDRDRIARDMHDLVVQRVFATGMSLNSALRAAPVPEIVRTRVERAIDDLDETITEIRRTIFDLQREDEPASSLPQRLKREIAQSAVLLGYPPELAVRGELGRVPADAAGQLLAALREGLSNAARHAQASQVWVDVDVLDDSVIVTVTDNGVGPPPVLTRKSGIANLAARASQHGGHSELRPGPSGVGSCLVWRVPLTPGAGG
jgi:signal transduction histidine kinase